MIIDGGVVAWQFAGMPHPAIDAAEGDAVAGGPGNRFESLFLRVGT